MSEAACESLHSAAPPSPMPEVLREASPCNSPPGSRVTSATNSPASAGRNEKKEEGGKRKHERVKKPLGPAHRDEEDRIAKEAEAERRRELAMKKSKQVTEEMSKKRTSQGDFVTRLHQDAITRKEALKKLEEGAREKELSVLKENSLGGKNVSKIVERLTQGSSEKVKEKRLRLQEEAEQKLREATEVKAFVSPESQKILAEKGIKDGSTLAERSRAMLARKSKALEEQQAKEDDALRKARQSLKQELRTSIARGEQIAAAAEGSQISRSSRSSSALSQALLAKPRPSTAPVRRPGRGSGDAKPHPPRDKVVIFESDDSATGGTAGGAVSVTRAQKKKPGVNANGHLATGAHSSGAGSEAPVFLASDAKMRELLAAQQLTITARDETIEAQLALLAERDATIAELNAQIERLSFQHDRQQQQTVEGAEARPASPNHVMSELDSDV